MKWLYLTIDFCTVLVPLIFSFHPKIGFYKTWKAFFAGSVLTAVIFVGWDIAFTARGVWSFNSRYVTGLYFFNLPIEEVLFFICIPYSCVFTYYCLDRFYGLQWQPNAERVFCVLLAGVLFIAGSIFIDRSYTSVTSISTAILILLLKFVFRINWFGKAVTVYAVLLAPFLVVNGILTGSGLKEAVVIYNSRENLGVRILTIPVEDIFYGFELFLLNLFFYHLLGRPSRKPVNT